jgi:peptide/nickel transport system permease protein
VTSIPHDSREAPPDLGGSRTHHVRRFLGGAPKFSLAFLIFIFLVAIFGPLIPALDPYAGTLGSALRPPIWDSAGNWDHMLGTDQVGRDILARLVYGARITVIIAIAGVSVAAVIGTAVGLTAGYFGGWVDALLMRITDATLAIPMLVLGLALATSLGPGVVNIVVVVSAITWAFFARLVRGEVLSLRQREYVIAARLAGFSSSRVLTRHVLPNVLTPILVMASLQVGNTIILAASLSFLGLGVPESQPEWGLMLANARDYISFAPYLVIIPALTLGLFVLAANLAGDWLRDCFDPHIDRYN